MIGGVRVFWRGTGDDMGCFVEVEDHGPCIAWTAPSVSDAQGRLGGRGLQMIELGRYEIDTWYWSPYPEPFASQEKLYLCEYCLKYFRKRKTLVNHMAKCTESHPPGDEIYRSPPPSKNRHENGADVVDPPIAVFEVGRTGFPVILQLLPLKSLLLSHWDFCRKHGVRSHRWRRGLIGEHCR